MVFKFKILVILASLLIKGFHGKEIRATQFIFTQII
jgi:hypothetical protein